MKLISLHLVLVLLFGITKVFAQPGGQPTDETLSENRRFSAEVSHTRLDKPLLTVLNRTGDRPVQVWSRVLVSENEEQDNMGMQWDSGTYRRFVGNDGSFVIPRAQNYRTDVPVVRVLTQKGGDKSFENDDLIELVDEALESEESGMQPSYLELLLDAEKPKVFALWHPDAAQWIVLDIEKLTLQRADAAQTKKLDEAGLRYARDLVRQHRPGSLQKMINGVIQRAANIIPGMVPSGNVPPMNEALTEAAYRFLAKMKNPEDKQAIEALLESELHMTYGTVGFGWGDPRPPGVRVGLGSEGRALGDELLTKWEGKSNAEEEDLEWQDLFFGRAKKLNRFGAISGRVNLPFAIPQDAGGLFIYLIPTGVAPGAWQKDESVLKAVYRPEQNRQFPGQPRTPPIDSVNFTFTTIKPGDYRVKAVWDRRPPNAPKEPNSVGRASPGDYESAETAVVKLAAGARIGGLEVPCTNRVGKADEYFAEDEAWAKDHPAKSKEGLSLAWSGQPQKTKVLVNAAVSDWVINTNENNGTIGINRIVLRESEPEPGRRQKVLELKVKIPGKARQDTSSSFKAELEDEHGCKFETHGYSSSGRIYQLTFPIIPFGSKRMTLEISREDFQDENGRPFRNGTRKTVLGVFTLTNLYNVKPEEWTAETIPAKRDLDIVSVELSSFNANAPEFLNVNRGPEFYGGGFSGAVRPYIPPQNKFAFLAQGKNAPGWRKFSGKYLDRWGNEAFSINQFCREEEIFKYAVQFARDPQKGVFLPEEKVEIEVKKIPSAGESVKVDARKELQGASFRVFSIGGTGEFTYEDGQFVSAKEEVEDEGAVPQFGPQGRAVQPKLYVKGTSPRGPMGMDWMQPNGMGEPITIISKIPHVACRVPQLSRDTIFALVEQDTSVPEPMTAIRQRPGMPYFGPNSHVPIQYLPLDYRANETDRKLTFVVQKTRKAEFIVRVPKDQRSER